MGERRGMKALELWCKKVTDGYPGVKVENMTTSWRDGLAFCALIHHFRPDLIDFPTLEKGDVYRNNELAFRTAERHLGIPALLDAEDMALYEVPDRLSILTYLSQFYQVFASQGSSPVKRSPEQEERSLVLGSTVQTPPSKETSCAISRKDNTCFKCNLPVFLAQRLIVNSNLHHRTCFRCARCNNQLTLANFYETMDNNYCCETCPDEELVVVNDCCGVVKNVIIDGDDSVNDDNINNEQSISLNNLLLDSDKKNEKQLTTAFEKTDELLSCRKKSLVGLRKMMFENIACKNDNISELTDDYKAVISIKKGSRIDKFNNLDDKCFDNDINNSSSLELIHDKLSDNNYSSLVSNDELVVDKLKCISFNSGGDESVNLNDNIDDVTEIINNNLSIDDNVSSEANRLLDELKVETKPDDEEICKKLSDGNEFNIDESNSEYIETKCLNVCKDDDDEIHEEISNVNEEDIKIIPEDNEIQQENVIEEPSEKEIVDKDETNKKLLEIEDFDYPSELNPFGDESEDLVEDTKQNLSTNPFESDMDVDEEEEEEEIKTSKSMLPKPATRIRTSKKSSVVNSNPFFTDEEDEDNEETKLISPPVPLPRSCNRKLNSPELSPTPIPRRNQHKVSPSITSLSSSTGVPESPSPRKKKLPAPAPPSQNSTLRMRKVRPPPPPPPLPPSNTSRPTTPSISSDISAPETPIMREKLDKDELNRQKQITDGTGSYPRNKSTFGQWKRKKNQAPPPPLPQRRNVKPMPLKQIRQELADIEVKQQELERQGVTLEQTIRDKFDHDTNMTSFVEELVLQLFELVNEKNELFRRQAELMYLRRQHNLEEEHAELEYQIRCLMMCPEHNKTDSDKEREEELIKRLVDVVERRNAIIQCLEMDRLREAEEDKSVNAQLCNFSAAAIGSEIDLTDSSDKKEKDKKLLKKEKKKGNKHSSSTTSLERDSEDTEKSHKYKKIKKKWLTLPHSKKI